MIQHNEERLPLLYVINPPVLLLVWTRPIYSTLSDDQINKQRGCQHAISTQEWLVERVHGIVDGAAGTSTIY